MAADPLPCRLAMLAAIRQAMRVAAATGHLELAELLYAQYPNAVIDEAAILQAATEGHLALLRWLRPRLEALTPVGGSYDFYPFKMIAAIAEKGYVEVVAWLLEARGEDGDEESVVESHLHQAAARAGQLEMVRWLRTHSTEEVEPRAIDEAAAGGYLEVVQFLHGNWESSRLATNRSSCKATARAMDRAAKNGHLAMVQWLHANRSEGCTVDAMNGAAWNGHADIVQWLHENRREGCTQQAMNMASKEGYIDIVQFLHEKRSEGCTYNAMDCAAHENHIEIVQWLHTNRSEGCSPLTMNEVAKRGHLRMVKWLHAKRSEGCTVAAMNAAATHGHLEIVQFLHSNRSEGCTVAAMDGAAENNHLAVVQWLHEHRNEGCSRRAMDFAARNGHLEVVQWLDNCRTEGCTTAAMNAAAEFGHLAVLQFLHGSRVEGCTHRAMDGAAKNGHLAIVQWLHENRTEGCTTDAMDGAARKGRLDIMHTGKVVPVEEANAEVPEDGAARPLAGGLSVSTMVPSSTKHAAKHGSDPTVGTANLPSLKSFGTATRIGSSDPNPMLRRTTRQRTASMLTAAVSMQTLVTSPTSKAELLARQNRAIANMKGPSKHISRAEKIAYRVDQHISTRWGQIATLTVMGIVLMMLGGCFLKAAKPAIAFSQTVWESWTYLADPGSHTSLIDDVRTAFAQSFQLPVCFPGGIIAVVSTLYSRYRCLLSTQLLLGWTDKSISLIRQICLANASENGGVIVVLAEAEKEELEAELTSQVHEAELRGTRVVFRTGTPLLSVDLLKVSAHRARSIIIMANSTGDADRSDAAVLRTVLSLKTLPELSGHIVAELRDIDNDPLVRLVGGQDVEILVSHDVIGRLVLMSARSPGLARVFSCLLGFDGNEFYFKEWPECVGVPFRELAERFPNAIPLGIKRKNGDVFICPEVDAVVEKGDQIMVLAEDDDTYKACPPVTIEAGKVPLPPVKEPTRERILMCGWRRDIRDMFVLLDAVVQPGTEVHMLCEEPVHLRNKLLRESGLTVENLKNIKLEHHFGNTAVRRHLEGLPWHSFTSIMILSDQALEADIMHSDSHSLASLLLIRDLQARSSRQSSVILGAPDYCKCISEILDPRTQRTISTSATILKLSEFIQSNELVSCILAMISESRDVRVILDELLGPQGAYFEVEPSARYCEPHEHVSFWQLAKRAMTQGEILCGYQVRGVDEAILNPTDKRECRTWGGVDLVVLRTDDDNAVVHQSPSAAVHADDFERTTHSRQVKATYSRQRLLEAIVQESDPGVIDEAGGNVDRETILRAISSFAVDKDSPNTSMLDIATLPSHQVNVRALIVAARMLADALEKAEAKCSVVSDDEHEEAVAEHLFESD
ncbi:hypothetical protein BBJ28_00011051 [Nothophytophthora sp. Chile5]|nr:hypothetical protein BBJ28_00011051 [Nothophytophthora sp. Chile5]